MSPANLNQVKEALEQVKRSASSAQQEVARLRKELEGALTTGARGLPVTRSGVEQVVRRSEATGIVPGNIYSGAGRFAPGGGRSAGIPTTLIPEETQRQIGPILTQIIGALIDFRESSKLAATLAKEVASREAALVGAVTGAAAAPRPTITSGAGFARAPFRDDPTSAQTVLVDAFRERANVNRQAAVAERGMVREQEQASESYSQALLNRAAAVSAGGAGGGRVPPGTTTGDLEDFPPQPPRPRGRQQAPAPTTPELQSVLGLENTENLLNRIKAANFTQADIKRVVDYGNSYKVIQLEQRRTVEGTEGMSRVMRRLNLTMDQAGNIFTSTQKQFRTFFSAIQRNIAEMIKWSAATLLVWGAIRKLSDLIQLAIDNETKLANIAVILGRAHGDLAQVFNDAAEAAAATGIAIDGVLEGYTQAYRATGNIADASERARVAQQLLIDSLILSRLSTLNQATAMDTLTGALRQAGLGLDEGQVLLDKWVAVSRKANVDMNTLAESFAITATAAQGVGLDIDKLNGIIATIAEVTTLSATESGNAIRAFISGFTSDAAVRELSQFGIAVTDTTGEARDFLAVMEEVAALQQAGIISDSELNKIAGAIGGGARREAQVVAVLSNLGRAQQVAEVSAAAHGEAEEALAIQLETVQTSITALANSFQVLARTLGDEGGVLNGAQVLLTIFEQLVKLATSLTKVLGDMTPIVTALAVAFAATSKNTRDLLAIRLGTSLSSKIPLLSSLLQPPSTSYDQAGQATTTQGGRLFRPGFGSSGAALGGQVLAGGFTALSAIQDVRQGNISGAVSSIAGGVIGALVTGGSPVGIVIGTAAGEAFANATLNYDTEFGNFFKEIFRDSTKEGLEEGVLDSEQAISDVFSSAGQAFTGSLLKEGPLTEAIGKFGSKIVSSASQGLFPLLASLGVSGFEGALGFTPEQAGLMLAGDEERRRVELLREQQQAQVGFGAQPGQFQLGIVEQQQALLADYGEFLNNLERVTAEETRARALGGEITERELRVALEQIPKLQAITTRYFAAFGEGFKELNPEIRSTEDAFRAFTDLVVNGSEEQIKHLSNLANEIAELQNQIDIARQSGQDFIITTPDDQNTLNIDETVRKTIPEAEELRDTLIDGASTFATVMENAMRIANIQLPSIVTLDVRAEDLDRVYERAKQLQSEFIAETFDEGLNKGLSEEDIRSTFEPIMVQAGESGGYDYAVGFMQQFLAVAVEQMQAAGEILAPAPSRIQLRPLDISSGEFPAAMARYQQLAGSIQSQLAGQGIEWSPDEETFAGLFTDYVAQPITADLGLLNLAMRELIDIEKKQLEGVYNLPTDSSFFVPFQGYKLGADGGGGGGAGAGALNTSASNLNNSADQLTLAAKLLQDKLERDKAVQAREERRPPDERLEKILARERRLEAPPLQTLGTRRRIEEFPPQPEPTEGIPPSPMYGPRTPDFSGRSFESIIDSIKKMFEGISIEDIIRMSLIQGAIVPVSVPAGEVEGRPRFDTEIPTTTTLGAGEDLLGTIRQFFINMFSELQSPGLNADVAKAGGLSGGVPTGNIFEKMNSVFDLLSQKIQNLSGFSTNLRITSTTTTNLIVDGRTLANIVKPYLYEDMIRFEESSTSISKNIVV
jgi:TP901 family phage tail tape measure protein